MPGKTNQPKKQTSTYSRPSSGKRASRERNGKNNKRAIDTKLEAPKLEAPKFDEVVKPKKVASSSKNKTQLRAGSAPRVSRRRVEKIDPKIKIQNEKQALVEFHKTFADAAPSPNKNDDAEYHEFIKTHCMSTTNFNKSVLSYYTLAFRQLMQLTYEHGKRAGQPLIFQSSESEDAETKEFTDKDLKALQEMFVAKLDELQYYHKYARRTPPDASTSSDPSNMRGPYKPAFFGDSPITDFLRDPNVKLGKFTLNGETFILKSKIPNILRGYHLGVTTANMIFNIYYAVNKLKDSAPGRGVFVEFSDNMRAHFGDKESVVLYTKRQIAGKMVKVFNSNDKISTFDALEAISDFKKAELDAKGSDKDGNKVFVPFDQEKEHFAGYYTRTIISLNTTPVDKLMEEWTLAGDSADADSLNSPLELASLKVVNDALHDKDILNEMLAEYNILNDVTKYLSSLKDGESAELEEEYVFEDDLEEDE